MASKADIELDEDIVRDFLDNEESKVKNKRKVKEEAKKASKNL